MRTVASLLIAAICAAFPVAAQVADAEESILIRARSLVKLKKPEQAIRLLQDHLREQESDVDARVLYGLILSWESKYDEGRVALERVLETSPDYKDARMALINLERWSDHPDRAASVALEGLRLRPKDVEFEEMLRKALQQAEDNKKKSQPKTASGSSFLETSGSSEASWEFGADRNQIWFSDKRSSWIEQSYSLARHTRAGWITGRLQRAQQGSTRSNLFEMEMYPKIRKGLYGLVSGSFSPDANLYAHRRFGTELFQSLPHGYEASLGYRYFKFGENVNMLTGSVAKYFGNWWFSGRTFITPDATGVSRSIQFSARRYFKDAEHFIGFRGGIGASPFEVRSINEVGVLQSESVGFEALWKFPNRLRMRASAGMSRQERIFTKQYLRLYSAGVTLYYGL